MNQKNLLKLLIFLLALVNTIYFFPEIYSLFQNAESLIASNPSIYIILMIIAVLIAPIPSSPLVILAGTIFGPFQAMLYTLIGATIGAVFAFYIARFFLRDYFKKYVEKQKWYEKFEGKNEKNIIYIIFLTRLMPQVSFDLVSYAAGLTRINGLAFTLVTFAGMIPIVFLLSFFGHLIKPHMLYFLFFLAVIFIVYAIYKYYSVKRKHF